ncbi:MAG: Leucine dehydrogenase [Chlamydiia bacterium]|nr:Leucine dehydrogenase [Chlamydiia bacterium]
MGLEVKDLQIDGYERVVEATDETCGFHAFIAIHNTTMGPSLGGTRFYPYENREAALNDVLRLAKGMTYKSAIAGVGLGGGKSVVITDPKKPKSKELLKAYAQTVNRLEGDYISAPDYGCKPEDIVEIRKTTKYVTAVPHEKGSGDPSFYTAWGTIVGVRATLKQIFGTESFKGKTFAVQGLGSVGYKIAEAIFWEGGELIVADPHEEVTKKAALRLGAKVVPLDEILSTPCDIFVPCALGGVLTPESIPELKCKGVAGCSNNQLLHDSDAKLLADRNILYAPDFVINGGGLINVTYELDPNGYDCRPARDRTTQIYDTLITIYDIAEKNNTTTHEAALSLCDYRLKNEIGKREKEPCFPEMAGIC